MSKWKIRLQLEATIEVEATDEDEAIDRAQYEFSNTLDGYNAQVLQVTAPEGYQE